MFSKKSKQIIALIIVVIMVLSTVGFTAASTFAATKPILTIKNVSGKKLTMKVGEKYKLRAKTSSGKITYKSSKPFIVTVSKKGILKAKKAGKATISLSVKYGKKKIKKKILIKVVKKNKAKSVKKKKDILARYIRIALSNIIPSVGSTVKATASVEPSNATNKRVTYSSSDTSVATVDTNGNIKIKKAGGATITVKSCEDPELKASVSLTAYD